MCIRDSLLAVLLSFIVGDKGKEATQLLWPQGDRMRITAKQLAVFLIVTGIFCQSNPGAELVDKS